MKKVSLATIIVLYSGIVGFFSVPVIAILLGLEEFGKSAYIQAVALWLSFACTVGLPYQMRQELASAGEAGTKLYNYGSNFIVLATVVPLTFLVVVIGTGLMSLHEAALVALYCITHATFTIDQACDLGQKKYIRCAWKQAEYITLANVGAIAAVYLWGAHWEYRIGFQIVGLALPLVVRRSNLSLFLPRGARTFKPDRMIFKRSMIITTHGSVDKVYTHLDKILIAHLFGVKTLGLYAFAVSVAAGLNLLMKMPTAWYEQEILSMREGVSANKLMLGISAAVLGVAAAGGAVIAMIPLAWLETSYFGNYALAKGIMITSLFYVAAKLVYAVAFPRFLRIRIDKEIIKFDLILLGPVLIISFLSAMMWGPEAYQISSSLGFLAVAAASAIYSQRRADQLIPTTAAGKPY